jgi:putative transposase
MVPAKVVPLKGNRRKNTYSTTYILKLKTGLLSSEEKRSVPRSTLHGWMNADMSHIIGLNPDEPFTANIDTFLRISEIPSLIRFNEAAIHIINFYKSVIDDIRGHKKLWKENREEIVQLVDKIKPDIGLDKACDFLRISSQQFYRWSKEVLCTASTFGQCRRLHPGQLTIAEQNTIKAYVTKPENAFKHLVQIYFEMMNDGAAFMAQKTFNVYAKVFRKQSGIPRKEKRRIGIRASAPLKLLHMDTTILRTLDGTRVYIHFIVDNFSRVILGWKASLSPGSINPAQNLLEVCERFDLFDRELDLLCDDGSENKGEVSVFLQRNDVLITRIFAQIEVIFSNSISEAANKSVKYLFLFPQKPKHFNDVIRILEKAVPEYNDNFPDAFHGLSRNDVLNGEIPDRHRFADQIRQAKENRPAINRSQTCGVC